MPFAAGLFGWADSIAQCRERTNALIGLRNFHQLYGSNDFTAALYCSKTSQRSTSTRMRVS